MSWQEECIPMLRVIINDNDISNLVYSDDRMEEMLVVSARYVQQEIDLTNQYTISIKNLTIAPDPQDLSDEAMINFMVLKAACLADWSTFRTKALMSGVEARCGPAVLRTLKHLDGFKELLTEGPCAAYKKIKDEHNFGNTDIIIAVLSPFVSNDFDPRNLASYDNSAWGADRGRDTTPFIS